MDEAGIQADIVTGTSVGSMAASLYASGMKVSQIEEKVLSLKEEELADLVLSKDGLVNGHAIAEWVNNSLANQKLEQLKIPTGIAVTDLNSGQSLLVTKGNIGRAVQSSSTIPGAFIPVHAPDQTLVDGGVTSPIPIRFARAMGADIVIGVDIYCGKFRTKFKNALQVLVATFRVMSCQISNEESKEADFIIKPDYEPKSYGNFDSKEEAIQAAYEATLELIPKLKIRLAK